MMTPTGELQICWFHALQMYKTKLIGDLIDSQISVRCSLIIDVA